MQKVIDLIFIITEVAGGVIICMWVKDEKGFKHKNNDALIVVVFP